VNNKQYINIAISSTNRLINHGPTVLVSTRDKAGKYDIAPVAWISPFQKSPPKMLLVVHSGSQTYRNIVAGKRFAVCVPHADQAELVIKTGSCSGVSVDKFKEFGIETFPATKVDALIPEGCVGYLECNFSTSFDEDIVVCDVLAAKVDKNAFDKRLLTESPAGKTLHHLGGTSFSTPSDKIIIL